MLFSLFYFADSADAGAGRDRYRLLLDGARFADAHGLHAVWTPERHFNRFGGLYPNPSVTGAAVAAVTERVAVRAGSVVVPLHNPLRIAEEWSVVDNLSGGRVGISLAPGWHAEDFVLRPDAYADRERIVAETAGLLRRLWRGESMSLPYQEGRHADVRIFPPPVQPELPLWITSSGRAKTFRTAGRLGAGVLTHLIRQTPAELAVKIEEYRAALREHAPDHPGHVTLMLHTFLGDDREAVRETVRAPFTAYLKSSIGLFNEQGLPMREAHADFIARQAFDRYFEHGGLFGTVEHAATVVDGLRRIGVDEIACLIDFGVPHGAVLASLERIEALQRATATAPPAQIR